MLGRNWKSAFLATAAAGAMAAGLGVGSAAAAPLPFNINPNAPGLGTVGYPNPVTATDLGGSSSALVVQTGPTTQVETGWLAVQSLFNNSAIPLSPAVTGESFPGFLTPNSYGLYLKFQGTVQGISGFAPGANGTVATGAYNFTLFADVGDNDVLHNAVAGPGGGTVATVTDTGGNDVVIATGSSITGQVLVNASTGAPQFGVLASFILCDGIAGQGLLGGVVTAAAACGTFDGTKYFTAPSPFYSLDFNTSTSGSSQDLTGPFGTGAPGDPINASINTLADVNFRSVPEPSSLLLFGTGLLGLGFFWSRKFRKA